MSAVTRPVLRWHGGKFRLAPWLIAHFPPHRIYVEPYGGAASALLRKEKTYCEVYNDLDGEVVNLFRILRDRALAADLRQMLIDTPFAREEFERAYEPDENAIERARRLIIRSFMGHGSDSATKANRAGFRANSNKSGTTPAHDWANYPDALDAVAERLRGVIVENRPAAAVMAKHDGPATLHYVDPPYLPETRARGGRIAGVGSTKVYRHEMTEADHAELLAFLQTLTGMVVLSGYPSALYDEALTGWRRIEKQALADGAAKRTEVLWLNPACVAALDAALPLGAMFEGAA